MLRLECVRYGLLDQGFLKHLPFEYWRVSYLHIETFCKNPVAEANLIVTLVCSAMGLQTSVADGSSVIYTTTDCWTTCTGNSGSFASTNPLWIARYSSRCDQTHLDRCQVTNSGHKASVRSLQDGATRRSGSTLIRVPTLATRISSMVIWLASKGTLGSNFET